VRGRCVEWVNGVQSVYSKVREKKNLGECPEGLFQHNLEGPLGPGLASQQLLDTEPT
jgi:hypothetical protein